MATEERDETGRRVEGLLRTGARDTEGFLDLTEIDLTGAKLNGLHFEHVRFSDEHRGRRMIRRVDFSGAHFDDARFPMTCFEDVKFQDSQIFNSDFRYAEFVGTSFARASLDELDMYRAQFLRGNIFEEANLRYVSLHLADLTGSDVRWSNFKRDDALMAATPRKLQQLLLAYPDRQRGISKQIDRAIPDAAGIYRHLTGLWHAKAQYADEAQAYVRLKRLERKAAWSWLVNRPVGRDLPKPGPLSRAERFGQLRIVVGHSVAERLCLFGERLDYIAAWLIALVFATAGLLRGFGGLVDGNGHHADFWRAATYALKNLIGIGSANMHPASGGWEFVVGAETLTAVLLVGLFGFVLANRLRYS